jgi:hypothetical protein
VKFRQKSAPGGWVDELNALRTVTSLPSKMDHWDSPRSGRLDIGIRVGNRRRSADGNFQIVGESDRLQLDCEGGNIQSRAR